jgi:hypothetical protein
MFEIVWQAAMKFLGVRRSKRRLAGGSGLLPHRQAPDVAAPGDGRTPIRCGFAARHQGIQPRMNNDTHSLTGLPAHSLTFPLSPLRPERRDALSYFGCGCAALSASVVGNPEGKFHRSRKIRFFPIDL